MRQLQSDAFVRNLPNTVMCWHVPTCADMCCHVQESVPEGTLLVYHTEHIPVQTTDPEKWETDAFLYQHVAQLNAAGRCECTPQLVCSSPMLQRRCQQQAMMSRAVCISLYTRLYSARTAVSLISQGQLRLFWILPKCHFRRIQLSV